ncbi:hypothetical protein ES703_119486 [subsurface metagenome]
MRVDKKSGNIDRFTVQPKVAEKEEDVKEFPLTPLIAFGYARTDSASKYLHKSVAGAMNEKVGLIARPCDTRALIELAKIKQVNLDNLFIIGIEDRGMLPKAGREMRSVKDVDPTKIVKEKFNLNPSDNYQAGYLVEKLFKQDRYSGISMTYHQIIDKYLGKS